MPDDDHPVQRQLPANEFHVVEDSFEFVVGSAAGSQRPGKSPVIGKDQPKLLPQTR